MEVKEVLQVKDSALFAVHPNQPLSEAVIMMSENDIGSVIVMEGGKLAGMLTFREVLSILAKRQTERRVGPTPPIAEILVIEAMDPNPPTTDPDMDVDELRRMMVDTHTRYVPVMEGDTIVGNRLLPRRRQGGAGGAQSWRTSCSRRTSRIGHRLEQPPAV
jgi:CBS domain-containing protein